VSTPRCAARSRSASASGTDPTRMGSAAGTRSPAHPERIGDDALDDGQRLTALLLTPGIELIKPCVYGLLRVEHTWSTVPVSTMRPAYITAMVSTVLGDDREIVRDQQQGGARPSLERLINSRIWAWIVTSSAVVGSSR